ncbi:MAG TPA: helix-turn-helix domain-containing protein [Acidimicrobiales bacterium]|nr:helix-turn-helix domain-containing protein [Acidimicrobiales bacterium]
MNPDDRHVAALAALHEPLRRRVYDHVATQDSPVSRDGAATALGVARSVAAFHLDKLAEVGLLEVEYRRPAGRGGPGAGRPAKWYRRAADEIAVSVPERHYDLVARLLARAVERAADGSVSVADALRTVAWDYGRTIGEGGHVPAGGSRRQLIEGLAELLAEHGYEPRLEDGTVSLTNCPFHALAEEHRTLVCGMNHDLMRGIVEAVGLPPSVALLDPVPGRCCVALVA